MMMSMRGPYPPPLMSLPVSQPAMRPTITHQINPNIVSFLYPATGMLFPGVGAKKHKVVPILDL